jgi:hypothetical protein
MFGFCVNIGEKLVCFTPPCAQHLFNGRRQMASSGDGISIVARRL